MVTDMTFHQTEDTFQCGSHFGWHKDNPHRSPWMCLDTKSMSVRRGSAPHCWKAKACNLTLIWSGTGRITNRDLQQQWKISSSERTYKICLHQQHSRSKSGKLHTWFWGASAHTACVLYLDLSPDQLQSGPVHRRPMSKSECQRQTWSTILLCSFIPNKNPLTYSGITPQCECKYGKYGQKICCNAGSCSGLHHWFRHSLRDWYWCSRFWRMSQRTLDANLVKKSIQGAEARYKMLKQEWMLWHKIQPP